LIVPAIVSDYATLNGSDQLPERWMQMSLIGIAIFGLIVGIIAKLLLPGKDPGGIFVTALIGMAGALVGLRLGRLFPVSITNRVDPLDHRVDHPADPLSSHLWSKV
jgi:uncharacterized membrane protein YeaQ/YmgE (transglycosylase-associated protein family)